MANAAAISIDATLLPDEISKILDTISVSYTPADTTEGWYYQLTDIQTTSRDLIVTKSFLQKGTSSAQGGVDTSGSIDSVDTAADKVKFLFIKHTSVEGDGTANTADSIYITLEGTPAGYNRPGSIEIGPGECWFGKLNSSIGDIHSVSDQKNRGSGSPQGEIQALVFAVIDDL
tara:strand:+ start:4344 stop:4865 length:522 start_codon:yes stop_codon:yes gene_type:complete